MLTATTLSTILKKALIAVADFFGNNFDAAVGGDRYHAAVSYAISIVVLFGKILNSVHITAAR